MDKALIDKANSVDFEAISRSIENYTKISKLTESEEFKKKLEKSSPEERVRLLAVTSTAAFIISSIYYKTAQIDRMMTEVLSDIENLEDICNESTMAIMDIQKL